MDDALHCTRPDSLLRTLTLRRCRELNSLLPLVGQYLPWLGLLNLQLLRPLLKQLAESKEHCISFEDLLHDSAVRELLQQAYTLQMLLVIPSALEGEELK